MAKAATKTTAKKPVAEKAAVKKTAAKKPTAKKMTAKEKKAALEAEAKALLDAAAAEAAKPRVLTHKLDMTHTETKRMLAIARKSGLLTTEELGKHIKIEGISAEDIEVALQQLSDLGISVIDEVEEETLGSKTLARTTTTAVKGGNSKDELDRTDDPVRMYLREMGVVELLSREGEIAIAKRIEAGRDTMIKGCLLYTS